MAFFNEKINPRVAIQTEHFIKGKVKQGRDTPIRHGKSQPVGDLTRFLAARVGILTVDFVKIVSPPPPPSMDGVAIHLLPDKFKKS